MGDVNPLYTLGDYSKPSHEGYRNTIGLLVGNNVVPLRSDTIRNAKLRHDIMMFQQHQGESLSEAWTRFKDLLQKDLTLYDNESWNDPRDFAKPVKTISLPQDVSSTSYRRLIELENQVQHLMEAYLALMQPTQVNKITTSCEIYSGPHDTQYCMEDLEQAFVEYASLRTEEAGGKWYTFMPEQNNLGDTYNPSWKTEDPQCSTHIYGLINAITIHPKQQSDPHNDEPAKSKEEEKDSSENTNTNPSASPDPSVSFIIEKVRDDGDVMFIKIVKKDDDSRKEELEAGGLNPIITEGYPSNLKIPCNIGDVHVEKVYIDLDSPLNIMIRMMYNWIMRRKLNPRENSDREVSNFTERIKEMHVFIGNFTFVTDFMIVEDISLIIIHRLSQVVLGKPFVDISNMTHDPPEGVVRFINGTNEIAYKMPNKIEQYNSLSDLEKEHTKSVYLRNEEDKKRGVEKFLIKNEEGFFTDAGDDVGINTRRLAGDGVTSIKRRRCDQSSDDVRIMMTASGHGRLKEDIESSTWR
uniref:Retrotransposon Orf1 n=1 Tax=Tanacetum cinerariifolium TaxID=118510 RepID=A0A6L2LGM3_TANCI|nr:retrotransposon Orf1 [Tanacetum cinerariifolium]